MGWSGAGLFLRVLGTLSVWWLLTLLVEPVFAGLAERVCPAGDDLLIVRVHELGVVSGSKLWTMGTLWTHSFAVGTVWTVWRVVSRVYAIL